MAVTQPVVDTKVSQTAPTVIVPASYKDPETGALFIHKDLLVAHGAWQEEEHIGPMKVTEKFGDVDAFVAYVVRYSEKTRALLSWNAKGLYAVLDYADEENATPGRRQWIAHHIFETSRQWKAWIALANGQAVGQKALVERLEDLGEDIASPVATDLTAILRCLRANVNTKAETVLREDGTSSVSFSKDTCVKSTSIDLPSAFEVTIPVLKGHVDEAGRPVIYRIAVRVRVSVDDQARLAFRLTMPNAERVLEDAYTSQVVEAKTLLGDDFMLLRAAD